MMIDVTVVPDSRRFSLSMKNNRLKVELTSPADRNRANIELITELSKALGGKSVRIISGLTSKRKKLSIDLTEAEWAAFQERIASA